MQRLQRIAMHMQAQRSDAHTSLRASHCASLGMEGPMDPAVMARYVRVAPEVAAALAAGRPVVALESTIISHGMPWPRNLETALEVEATARAAGATPATVAILAGVIHVGLEREQLEQLAQLGEKCAKCSRRDLALLVARKAHGATTVSATMLVASWAGIPIFVTGGIGGVHRGVQESMDISADLIELGRTPVTVICAGVKSILDIPRTLEFLETQGVAVAAYGTSEFPAFFTRNSGVKAPARVDTPEQAAGMIAAARALRMNSGGIIAVPVPEAQAAQGEVIERATTRALAEAKEKKVLGRDITPFLLARIAELTKGSSLDSNIALVLNNVRIGSAIAVELAKMQQAQASAIAPVAPVAAPVASVSAPVVAAPLPAARFPAVLSGPLVMGGANQDLLGRPAAGSRLMQGTSNPGTIERAWGGVGRNLAEVLGRLGARPHFLGAVGLDDAGSSLIAYARQAGVQVDSVLRSTSNCTATYMAVLDEKGDLFTTVADMAVCDEMTAERHLPSAAVLASAPMLLLDGNLSADMIARACALAATARPGGVPVLFEPTSLEKCVRGVRPLLDGQITFVTPSAAELQVMAVRVAAELAGAAGADAAAAGFQNVSRDAFEHNDSDAAVEAQCCAVLQAIADRAEATERPLRPVHILLKRGARGALVASLLPGAGGVSLAHLPAGRLPSALVNTSGAGDTLAGAAAWSLLQQGAAAVIGADAKAVMRAVQLGMRAAELTLVSPLSVSPHISAQALEQRQREFEGRHAAAKL